MNEYHCLPQQQKAPPYCYSSLTIQQPRVLIAIASLGRRMILSSLCGNDFPLNRLDFSKSIASWKERKKHGKFAKQQRGIWNV